MKAEDDLHCRVVIIGDSAVGKTSLLNRIVSDSFNQYELSTVGANYQLITKKIEGRKIEIQVWDTAGQERFRSLSPIYFRNAIGAIAVYDQTNKPSFEHLDMWLKMFTDVAGTDTIIAIAANKSDLTDEIEVDPGEAKKQCEEKGFLFGETSAQSGNGVQDLFNILSEKILEVLMQKRKASLAEITPKETSGCSC